jgi:glycosyltransferase involved in cell wall biosynthesis
MVNSLATVNILNFNRAHKLKYTFESIVETAGYNNWELSVTDNGSTDGSINYLKDKFKVVDVFKRLVLLPRNYGEGRGAGVGMSYAKGDILIHSCNDLKFIRKGWLREVVDVMRLFPEVICYAPVVTKNYPGEKCKRENTEIKINAPGIPAFCVSIRKKDYDAIGGFKDCGKVMGPKQLKYGKWGMEPLFAEEVRQLASKKNLRTGCALPLESAATHDWTERGYRDTVYKWVDEKPRAIQDR